MDNLTVTGVLKYLDIGTGGWVLETSSQTYELEIENLPQEACGTKVSLEGQLIQPMSMLNTSHPILRVLNK
jgi:hypothetical protein